jgi:hypothetical protein
MRGRIFLYWVENVLRAKQSEENLSAKDILEAHKPAKKK